MLLGVIAMATGVKQAVGHSAQTLPVGPSLALAGGVTLFLAGDVAFRRALRIGPSAFRSVTAVLMLATAAAGVAVAIEVELAAQVLLLAAALAAERRWGARDVRAAG
jgi:low temperature requirement protein LtrA